MSPTSSGPDALLAGVVDASPDGIVALDRELRCTAWNPAMERLTGIPAAQVLGRSVHDALPFLRAPAEAALRGERLVSPEQPFPIAGSGREGWVEARCAPLRDDGGEVVGAMAVVRDVPQQSRHAEAALRESEERFRSLADTAPVMIWLSDTENLGTYFNRTWLEFTGRSLDEELGAGWVRSIHPGDRERAAGYCMERFAAREEFRMEFRMRRADGEYRWVLDHGIPRYDGSGRFLGYIGSCMDVTDLKEAEALREAQRDRLQRVLAQLPAAVAVYEGPDHVFAATSDQYHRIVGRKEVLGRPFREVLPELESQGFGALLDRVYATGEPQVGTGVRAVWDDDGDGRPEEHLVDFAYQPLVDGRGRIQGVVACLADVTERERAAQELRDSREEAEQGRRRFALLAEASRALASSLEYEATIATVARLAVPALADWCFVEMRQPDGSVKMVAVAHTDPEREELAYEVAERYPIDLEAPFGTGRVLRTGEPELAPEIPDEVLELVAQDEEHLRILRAMRFRSSLSVPIEVRGRTEGVLSLVASDSGRRYGEDDVRLAREVARRAAVAIDNARLYEEARTANRAKASFLAVMSHELRTPLNAMIGYVDLLLLGVPSPVPAGARKHVERIRLASQHLLSIIEEILTFSRIEAGREVVEREAVDLLALVGEVSAIIEPLAADKGLAFRVPDRVEPASLHTDPRKLRQILVNLLGNAVKFTHAGSVAFEVERADGWALFRVRDTGVGIAPESQEVIFEPFRQVEEAMTRSAGGTGLGLAVSRQLARLLGGDVTVESASGVGSTFTVRLPLEG